jgi:hypothetical protein
VSEGWVARLSARNAEDKDKDLLLRAAFDVVLQRDISLSRRVHTWLIGTSETSEEQIGYFRTHGLDAVCHALEADMTADPTSARPLRTFLALLDKWEVGSGLAARLVLPALRAIRTGTFATDHIAEVRDLPDWTDCSSS